MADRAHLEAVRGLVVDCRQSGAGASLSLFLAQDHRGSTVPVVDRLVADHLREACLGAGAGSRLAMAVRERPAIDH